MKKRVFIIHGWGGYPKECWFPWLKKELEKIGFIVNVPIMPFAEKPEIKSWVSKLLFLVGKPNKETYFVGHSIGCQTILRYLEKLSDTSNIGGIIFVAGWFVLTPESTETDEEKKIANPWFETPINFERISKLTSNIVAIFSDNDPYVPFRENSKIMKKKLNAKIILEHNKGHFSGSDKITKLPIVLDELSRMIK